MCGIVGLATRGESPDPGTVKAMADALRHRGPDGEGFFVGPGVGLGMRRLAVIDLVTGDQPMSTPDGSVQVVFNGEIYNYRELRRDLEGRGYRLRTQSDTEVLPYLYEVHGVDFLERLNGMFALALWDATERRLLLARDRVGIKPLHYATVGDRLYFASEVKSMLAVEPGLGALDVIGLHQYLSLEYTLGPNTLFADVRKLPAGGWLIWQDGTLTHGRFWQIPDGEPDARVPVRQATEELREAFLHSVRRQLVSDVPLGAFLSGGVDSSTLVAAMSQVADSRPKTFSVGFGQASYNELSFARTVARAFDTDHHEELIEPDFLSHLDTVVEHLDQPIADFSVFPTLLVARMARQHVTVALSGDGGDELFCGYDTYRAQRASRHAVDWLPQRVRNQLARLAFLIPLSQQKRGIGNTLRRFLEGLQWSPDLEHLRWMLFLAPTMRSSLYVPEYAELVGTELESRLSDSLKPRRKDRLHGQMVADVKMYLTENILPKVDLMSMAVSLEARVPFLDNEVIDLALRLPSSVKWREGQSKWILKEAFRDLLPPPVLSRRKEGFSIPMKNWLKGDWNALMHELLDDGTLYRDGLFQRKAISRLMHEHESGSHNHSHLLWALMLFQLWTARFRTRPSAVTT
jgi:asparagine synthase (glutamine-hydrolysing)